MEALNDFLTPQRKRVLIKVLSLGAGLFLVFAGALGCTAPILGGGLVYFIGAIYAVFFGLLVVVVELKNKTPVVSIAYGWVDKYIKFLTFQRGKGMFYLGVGLLVYFIAPEDGKKGGITGHWGINNVAALFLAIVGALHTFHVIRDESGVQTAPAITQGMPPPSDGLDFSRPLPQQPAGGKQWARMVDEPDSRL